MGYEQILAEDRRLVILRTLNEIASHEANESVLETVANQIGVPTTRNNIREDISYLEKAGCISISWYADKLMLVKLKQRGRYFLEGKELIQGIKSPSLD